MGMFTIRNKSERKVPSLFSNLLILLIVLDSMI
jgi:hypothetical protein